MADTEAHKKAQKKYDEKSTTKIVLRYNVKTDADVIRKLTSVPNKQAYIKKLIRDDL